MATAKAIPVAESVVRTGLRARLRSAILGTTPRRGRIQAAPALPRWKAGGGSGRIASAGGSVVARRTAPSAPAHEEASATETPVMTVLGSSWKARVGKRYYAL